MKHSVKITILMIAMFFVTQLMGIAVINSYLPESIPSTSGDPLNLTEYDLPYGLDPQPELTPKDTLMSIIIAIFLAVILMLTLIKFKAEKILRAWFLIVIILAISITLNPLFSKFSNPALIAFIIALPLGIIKVFQRNFFLHNATELLVYPGIAAIFVPLLNIWSTVILLILISAYDAYAVWHAGFMQKMAKYQIEKVKVFAGFFIPHLDDKQKKALKGIPKSKLKTKKIKVNLAILGGGDVVFPIILAGVVLISLGLIQALLISVGATLALTYLLYKSEKGKFYPAMPFISTGCLIALGLAYLI
jgi:presenilin-like A22 family membrane protease